MQKIRIQSISEQSANKIHFKYNWKNVADSRLIGQIQFKIFKCHVLNTRCLVLFRLMGLKLSKFMHDFNADKTVLSLDGKKIFGCQQHQINDECQDF